MKRHQLHVTAVRVTAGVLLAAVTALSATAAEPPKVPPQPPKGLVLHFKFDQADAGPMVADRSGHKNNGRATGAKWTASGKQGGGCEFTSAGSYIQVPNHDSLNMPQVTVAVWFKTSKSDAVWRRILDKRAARGYGLGIGGDSKDLQSRGRLVAAVNGNLCLSDAVVADGAWHHGAATLDGDNLRLYVDGQPQRQVAVCRTKLVPNADDLTIGMNRSDPSPQEKGQSFDGVIDEVMVFNRALSADEIKAMVVAVDPSAAKPKFTKQQVAGRLRQLKALYEEGLITEDFYRRKVEECEAGQ